MPRQPFGLLLIALLMPGLGRAQGAPTPAASSETPMAVGRADGEPASAPSSSAVASESTGAPQAAPAEVAAGAPESTGASQAAPAEVAAGAPESTGAPQAAPAEVAAGEPDPADASGNGENAGAAAGAESAGQQPAAAVGAEEESLLDEEAAARELAELQAVEAAAVDEESRRAEELLRTLELSGAASPLRQRMGQALDFERALPLVPSELEMGASALAGVAGFDLERARRLYDIPVEMHPLVAEYIRFFQGPGRKHFVRWLGRAARYQPMIRKTLGEAGLPQDTVFLAMIESGFSPVALSTARAAGLWQFIEPTGKRFGLQVDFWVDERRDPVKATVAAAGYLKELYSEFGDWRLAWAGYNAGAGKVRRAIREDGSTDFWVMTEGRVLKRETKHYVPKLMAAALVSKNLAAFGFSQSEIDAHAPLAYEEAEVPEATDLAVIARAAGVGENEIKELNPQLRRWCTPPARSLDEPYKIRLPVGTRERFVANYAQIAPKDRLTYRTHKIERGDTLSRIAYAYGTEIEPIKRVNHITDVRRLRLGETLVIPVPRAPEGAQAKGRRAAAEAPARATRPTPKAAAVPAVAPAARSLSGKIHVVAAGDSLWTIARQHDVHVDELVRWNGLRSKRVTLRIGQKLVVGLAKTARK